MKNRVKILREKMGWSQEELASRMGTSQQTVSHIESGQVRLNDVRMKQLVAVLNCTVGDLFERTGFEETSNSYSAVLPLKESFHSGAFFDIEIYANIQNTVLEVLRKKRGISAEDAMNFIKKIYDMAIKKGGAPSRETVEWLYEDTFETKIF